MKRLYFDMDNVLVDFASGISKLDAKTVSEYEDRLDEVPGIFSLMEPTPDAIDTVNRIEFGKKILCEFQIVLNEQAPAIV